MELRPLLIKGVIFFLVYDHELLARGTWRSQVSAPVLGTGGRVFESHCPEKRLSYLVLIDNLSRLKFKLLWNFNLDHSDRPIIGFCWTGNAKMI